MVEKIQGQPTILAADDDEDAHYFLKRAFTKAGINVSLTQVYDGDGVIRYLSKQGEFSGRENQLPNLLLLDLKMPKTNGFDVLEYLQRTPQFKSIPAIVFSSSSNATDVQRARSLGCHSYVVKPASFDEMQKFVAYLNAEFLAPVSNGSRATSAVSKQPSPTSKVLSDEISSPKRTLPKVDLKPADSPEMFRLLVDQVKDYGIFILNPDGYILSWNEGARRIKGYEANEIIGQHFSAFYTQSDNEKKKPDFELKRAKEMGRYEEEGWRVRKDGTLFWANVVITPLYSTERTLLGFAKVTRDLTQRKLQEENLQSLLESEERFRLLVDQVKDYAIFILDARGHIVSWNQGASRLKGYTADDVLNKHFSLFYTPEDIARDHPANELSLAVRDGRYEEEGWRVRKDGSRFWANVVITALWDKRGNLNGFAKVTRDLTQKKREQDALRRKTEELETFAHTLSHDLRAPLRSISSFAQILSEEAGDMAKEDLVGFSKKIFGAAKRLDSLITDVLRLSELSVAPLSSDPVSASDVIAECLELLDADIQRTKARVDLKEPLPVVRANRALLLQLFSNLISNALKFSREDQNPKIEIFGILNDRTCELHVKDNGIGIPQEFHKTIFELFARGNAKPETEGTGIGLSIVKKIVDRIGGTISLKSKEGEGSEFIIKFDEACGQALAGADNENQKLNEVAGGKNGAAHQS